MFFIFPEFSQFSRYFPQDSQFSRDNFPRCKLPGNFKTLVLRQHDMSDDIEFMPESKLNFALRYFMNGK
jgi:hypothetical protein